MRGGGPICIITASGMICESLDSYVMYYRTTNGREARKTIARGRKVPQKIKDRVNALMDVANADDAPFMVVQQPHRRA